jgi:hypothetical protein
MNAETRERLKIHCGQATKEEDLAKLLELVTEFDQILAEKQERLKKLTLKI